MEIAEPVIRAVIAGVVASLIWAWTDSSWGVRPIVGHAIALSLIAYVGLAGPVAVG